MMEDNRANLISELNHWPKSFKWLIFANIVFAIGLICILFGISFFGFGGYPPFAVLGGISLMSMFYIPFAVIGVFVMDIIFGFRLWKRVGIWVIVPFVIFIVSFPSAVWLGDFGRELADNRFDKYFSQYEQAALMIKDGSIPITEDKIILLPSGYRNLASYNRVFVEKDGNNVVIEFMVGSGGFAGHVAYLYSSYGIIAEGSYMAKRWPRRTKVKENWFRASD
ncbi:MAG TPA: hypothetical protein VJB62_01690 [Patescibacteria group bacterium]|nr:hypothetical protein [Patescibacteria group bacterium]